jgi:hypothetical protein
MKKLQARSDVPNAVQMKAAQEGRAEADLHAEHILSDLEFVDPELLSDPADFAKKLQEYADIFDQEPYPIDGLALMYAPDEGKGQ